MFVNFSPNHRTVSKPRSPHPSRCAGFSLIEVMVALIVCSIGLLGLAKMESLALSSTNVAGFRAIAAIEASSLAAAMHADPGYWAGGFAPAITTVTFDSSGVLQILGGLPTAPTAGCLTAGASSCTPGAMAAYDVQRWAYDLKGALPAYLATIVCSTTGFPVTCTVKLQWTESAVAANARQTNIAALAPSTYTLFVQP
jgi:type IV pilus assembly protein PilV